MPDFQPSAVPSSLTTNHPLAISTAGTKGLSQGEGKSNNPSAKGQVEVLPVRQRGEVLPEIGPMSRRIASITANKKVGIWLIEWDSGFGFLLVSPR